MGRPNEGWDRHHASKRTFGGEKQEPGPGRAGESTGTAGSTSIGLFWPRGHRRRGGRFGARSLHSRVASTTLQSTSRRSGRIRGNLAPQPAADDRRDGSRAANRPACVAMHRIQQRTTRNHIRLNCFGLGRLPARTPEYRLASRGHPQLRHVVSGIDGTNQPALVADRKPPTPRAILAIGKKDPDKLPALLPDRNKMYQSGNRDESRADCQCLIPLPMRRRQRAPPAACSLASAERSPPHGPRTGSPA